MKMNVEEFVEHHMRYVDALTWTMQWTSPRRWTYRRHGL